MREKSTGGEGLLLSEFSSLHVSKSILQSTVDLVAFSTHSAGAAGVSDDQVFHALGRSQNRGIFTLLLHSNHTPILGEHLLTPSPAGKADLITRKKIKCEKIRCGKKSTLHQEERGGRMESVSYLLVIPLQREVFLLLEGDGFLIAFWGIR